LNSHWRRVRTGNRTATLKSDPAIQVTKKICNDENHGC
jgi:hypothetical protein